MKAHNKDGSADTDPELHLTAKESSEFDQVSLAAIKLCEAPPEKRFATLTYRDGRRFRITREEASERIKAIRFGFVLAGLVAAAPESSPFAA